MDSNLLVCNLPEDCSIRSIRKASDSVKDAWKAKRQIILNLKEVESIDLTGIQLILSLYKSCAKENRVLRIADPVPASVADAFRSVGMLQGEEVNAARLEAVLRSYQEERLL